MFTKRTLVLNADYCPLDIVGYQEAIRLIYVEKAQVVIDEGDKGHYLNTPNSKVPYPSIIRLTRYNQGKLRKVKLTRLNIFRRDKYTCAYCKEKFNVKNLTVDHIHPKSKGGPDSWANWITACKPCNSAKGDMSLQEFGYQDVKGFRPSHVYFMGESVKPEWNDYLMFR